MNQLSKSFDEIRKDNKLLMMELQGLNRKSEAGKVREKKIRELLRVNNQDLAAMSAAIVNGGGSPRLMQYKQANQMNHGSK